MRPSETFPGAIDPESMNNLMRWFSAHRRVMPWRGEENPYRIWVSEVMLQQTQVVTVVSYYNRWIRRFPTIEDIASADVDSALELWQGLGYYNRVQNLLRGTRYVMEHHAGSFPRTRKEALLIPGVGDYIAGAVLSIAYNLPEPAVDGNVIRVISRLRALLDTSPSRLRQTATGIIAASYHDLKPRWVNQAWMELGALQCTPRPVCDPCPFASICLGLSQGKVADLPATKKKKPVPHRKGVIYLVRRDDRILMVKRPGSGLLPNLWELPNILETDQDPDEFLRVHHLKPLHHCLGTVNHAYSHFRITCDIHAAELHGAWSSDRWIDHCWMDPSMLNTVAKPGLHLKALKIAGF